MGSDRLDLVHQLDDPGAMAAVPIGLEADKTAPLRARDVDSLGQGRLRRLSRELLRDDLPESSLIAAAMRDPSFLGRAQRLQMRVADAGLLERGGKLAFGKAGAARLRQLAHIDHHFHRRILECRDEIGEPGLFVSDRADLHGEAPGSV